jgi:hypothetical protein
MKTRFFNIGLNDKGIIFEESFYNGRFCAVFDYQNIAIELIDCSKITQKEVSELSKLCYNEKINIQGIK